MALIVVNFGNRMGLNNKLMARYTLFNYLTSLQDILTVPLSECMVAFKGTVFSLSFLPSPREGEAKAVMSAPIYLFGSQVIE